MKIKLSALILFGVITGQTNAYECGGVSLYQDGAGYSTGDVVQNNSTAYLCDVGGWCTVGGPYAPGEGWAWTEAWSDLGACSGSSSSSSSSSTSSTSSSSGGLPSPWQNTDVGSPTPGSTYYEDGEFTTTANGNDIWNTSDNFHFVYQTLNGNGGVTARVTSLDATNQWAKAGVMIRESLNANSSNAMMAISSANGAIFQRRTVTGDSSVSTTLTGISTPYWVRLVRTDNTFTGYISSDGSNWSQVVSDAFGIGSTAYVGLAHTSHADGILGNAQFTDVSVQAGAVCFYEGVNFSGASFCSDAETANVESAWNDRVSSIRVLSGYAVTIYENYNQGGSSVTLTADVPDLGVHGIDDSLSSYSFDQGNCSPTAITPYVSVNGGDWQQILSVTINSGDQVSFGPQPATGDWSWSGCGSGGTSREQTVFPSSSCSATATYTNDCGADSSASFSVTVSESGSGGDDTWRQANLTHYTSYPDPDSDECEYYNGCQWAGYFAFVSGQQSESWVQSHNIAAVHERDADTYKLKTLRLRQDGRLIDVTVYDMCSDSDCSGCCTANADSNGVGFLIDIEKYTMQRFGSGSGVVEWQCLDCD